MIHENADTRTQQRPVNYTFIRYCWDAHSTAVARGEGAWETDGDWQNKWMSRKTVRGEGRGGKGVDPGRSLRLTFPVCVRHESAHCSKLVVCLCHSSVYSFLTWWLGLLIPHLLQQLLPTQYFSMGTVFMCCVRAMAASGGKWCYL